MTATTSNPISCAKPVSPLERLQSLDVLRGFALPGILLVNIQIFAMISAANQNPTAYGDLTGFNYVVSLVTYTLGEYKFMTIFALLFGAGIYMMTRNIQQKGKNPAPLHFQRMLWLVLIGMMHAYLVWHGDILVYYAICGLLAYLFRKLSPKKLLITGFITICIGSLIFVFMDLSLPYWPPELINETVQSWQPGDEAIARELAINRGGWMDQMQFRIPAAMNFQTTVFLLFTFWRAFGLMLLGMALFKWDILTGKAARKTYRKMIYIGAGIGIPMTLVGWFTNFQHDWAYDYAIFEGAQFNYWGSLFISAAYIGAIILLSQSKSPLPSRINRSLSAMGRMAFTNYLMQSILCTLIFYGHGLGLFGKVDRSVQFLIVLLLTVLQAWYSPLWLKHYRFGPMEWLWRTLTYKKKQPMKI